MLPVPANGESGCRRSFNHAVPRFHRLRREQGTAGALAKLQGAAQDPRPAHPARGGHAEVLLAL